MTSIRRPRHRRPVRLQVAVVFTLVGGVLLALAMPPAGFWILAPFGLALVLAGSGGRGYAGRFGVIGTGLLITNIITLGWLQDLHPAALVLIPILAAYDASIIALAPGSGPARSLGIVSTVTLAAAFRSSIPWGGVPLSSLALTQAGGPLIGVARLGTDLAVVALVATAAVMIIALASHRWVDATVAGVIGGLVLVVSVYAPSGSVDGMVRIAAVQGGGELGTRARDSDSNLVFERHVDATRGIDTEVDLVLWPEDVVTTDAPFSDSAEMAILRSLSIEVGAELVVGLIERDGDRFRNAAVVVGPEGELDRYEKVNRVPFGEFIPWRGLVESVVGEVGSLVPRDAAIGVGPAHVDTEVGRFATVISFELFFHRTIRTGVKQGGGVLLGPTNGSSYPDTRVPEQTLASSRLRAVESGRWVVQAAPTGYTAVVDADGKIVARSGLRESAVIIEDVTVRRGQTWAIRYGSAPLVVLAALGLAVAAWFGPRREKVSAWLSEPVRPSEMRSDEVTT